MINCKACTGVLGAAIAAALGLPVMGQDSGLEEIIVTSRYREENLQQTPLAITAITGEALELRSLENVEDLGVAIPNAFIRPNVSNFGPNNTVGLRDVIQQDFLYAFEPAVGVYIDDVYHGTLTGSSFDLMDIERVEVLRGPQGTLFGKNSLGGAIRLVSKKPTGDDSGYIDATYGDFDRVDIKGVYDFALVPEKVAVRITGVSKHQDGYMETLDFACDMKRRGTPQLAGYGDGVVGYTPDPDGPFGPGRGARILGVPNSAADNAFAFPELQPAGQRECVTGTMGGTDLQAARVMLNITPSDRLEIGIAADFSDDESEARGDALLRGAGPGLFTTYLSEAVLQPRWGVDYASGDNRFVTETPYQSYATWGDPVTGTSWDRLYKYESQGISFSVDYDLGEKSHMHFIAANRSYLSDWTSDSDFTPFEITTTNNLEDHDQDTVELQFTGSLLNDRLDWTAGAFYYDAQSFLGGRVELAEFNAAGFIPEFDQNDKFWTTNKSVFFHVAVDLTEKLAFSGGVRSTDEDKKYTFDHTGYLTVPDPLLYGQSRTDWKAGLDYTFTDNVFGFISVATGYRSDGAQPRPWVANQVLPTPAEELENTEVGIKLDVLDDRLRINANVFKSDYDPRVIGRFGSQCNEGNDPSGPGQFFQLAPGQNCPAGTPRVGLPGYNWFGYFAASGDVEGFELELTASPTENLAINYSFGHNKFTSADQHPSFLLQPENNMSAGLQYTFNFANGGMLSPRLDWFYQSKRTNGPSTIQQVCPAHCIDAYDYFNGRLTYFTASRDWSLSLAATNLTDEFYWLQLGSDYADNPAILSRPRSGVPSAPRMWTLSLRKNFGGSGAN